MKTLIVILMLTLITACGKGGGSSSSGGAGNPNDNGGSEAVYSYEIRVEGVAGASIASTLITNFGAADQASQPVIVTLDASQLAGATFYGRNIYWDIQSTSANPVTVKILRDGVEVKSETLTSNGQIKNLTDNL